MGRFRKRFDMIPAVAAAGGTGSLTVEFLVIAGGGGGGQGNSKPKLHPLRA